MNADQSFPNTDKFELHYRQQLSALIDGELAADEARFLLRRLEHDDELSGLHERWQLCGDVLRGAACAPAPQDFAARVRAAVAAEPPPQADGAQRRRPAWRWGGGAALAASVAAVALFMARERLPDPSAAPAPTELATVAQLPAVPNPPPSPVPADPDGELVAAAVPAAALASLRRQEAAGRRAGGATRTRQAARVGAALEQPPQVASAAAAPVASPFAHPQAARPWPRSALAGTAEAPFNASFQREDTPATFYPFDPRQSVQAAPTDSGP